LALVQRAELVTKVAAGARRLSDGSYAALSQSVARYDLLTKATLLEIRLPPRSTLWTIYLDDQPTKPQREGESLLVSLPAQAQVAARKLQIVYESPSQPLGLSGTVEAVAPVLLVRAVGSDEEREIPQADLQWQLLLPGGYEVHRVGGTVSTDVPPRTMAAVKVAAFLYTISGGIQPWWSAARESILSSSGADYYRGAETGAAATSKTAQTFDDGYMMPATEGATKSEPESVFDSTVQMPELDRPAERRDMAAEEAPAREPAAAEPAPAPTTPPPADPAVMLPPPEATPPPPAGAPPAAGFDTEEQAERTKFWALEGVSSLKIDIQADEEPDATFHSLGARPRLEAGVVDTRRIHAAAWGLSLLIFLVGVGLTRRTWRDKAAYLVVVLVAATVPLLLTTALDEVGAVFDYVFFAGCALVAWYLVAAVVLAVVRWLKGRLPADCCQPSVVQQITAILLAALLTSAAGTAFGQPPPDDSLIPVAVPADAIIIPYDPEKPIEDAAKNKLLVPYPQYVELWNIAYPEKRIDASPPPREFAIAGTSYEATLSSGDFLSLAGKLEIEVYTDKPLTVPLALAGGVLERATVDGQAARLQVVEPQPVANQPEQQQAAPNPAPNADAAVALPPRMLLLHLAGKGRKVVQLNLRLGLSRQGGWRIVHSQLPVGPAAALTLLVPQTGTEVRQMSLPDKATFETSKDNERIETALSENGALELQWRPKIAEGQVDQALTTKSTALFDVREDALRLVWQLQLEFGRGTRDAFTFTAPADYLVEQVLGENVRGWTAKAGERGQRIEVTLLKAATGSETVTLHLAKRGRVGEGELAEFDAPAVLVEGAALEQGTITVRRSPRLDLRTIGAVGLSRADNAAEAQPLEQLADSADAAVLVVRPHQSFRFVKPPFRLTLAASPLTGLATAYVRAALQAFERGTTLDAAIAFRPEGQPLYQVRVRLPEGFTVQRIGPGDLEWSISPDEGGQLLTVQLLDGRTEEFTLTLYGKVAAAAPPAVPAPPKFGDVAAPAGPRSLPLPKLEILDVEKQEGEIVVVTDRDTDVRLADVKGGDAAPLTSGPSWMVPEQQSRARAILRYRSVAYSANVVLTPRQPIVSARSITNVKITPQAIEETVVLDFRIEQAGIRSLSLLLPEHLGQGRIRADLLQRKIVEPATGSDGQPLAGWVRMRLLLQDFVDGEYRVVLEHDRLLSADKQTVKLPVIETGRTDQRLLAVENAGRDEVVIDAKDVAGLEPLSSQQQAWRDLVAALQGGSITQAFAAVGDETRPQLVFSTRQRERVADDGARIELATTIMVVDEAGTYRALQEYRVSNATLQYLEIELPAGARLWTATVAGQPVKAAAGASPQLVRIPLIKSAAGEGDYPVQLKYGGQMPRPSLFTSAQFSFIKTVNVNVVLSQVQLWLPETREWFGFFGTMREETEAEQAVGFQSYLNGRIEAAAQMLSSADDYTKARLSFNLKQSRLLLDNSRSMEAQNNLRQFGLALQSQLDANDAILEQAEQQAQVELAQPEGDELDNRGRLNQYWEKQDVKRSKAVASELGSNFDGAVTGTEVIKGKDANLNEKWFDQNKLRAGGERDEASGKMEPKPGNESGYEGKGGGRFFRGGKPGADDSPQQGQAQVDGEQKAPQLAAKEHLDELQKKLGDQDREVDGRKSGEQAQNLQRYQQQLEQQGARDNQSLGLYGQSQGQPQGGAQASSRAGGMGGAMGPQATQPGMPGGSTPMAADPMAAPVTAATPASATPAAGSGTAQAFNDLAQGRASLDITLPERGRLYRFTTPRGDVAIEAYSVPHVALRKLAGLAAVLVAILVVWLLGRERSLRVWRGLFRTLAFGIVLVVIGLASVISGVLPLAGLLLIGIGLALSIRAAWRPAQVRAV
jgi:hypothetical protein